MWLNIDGSSERQYPPWMNSASGATTPGRGENRSMNWRSDDP